MVVHKKNNHIEISTEVDESTTRFVNLVLLEDKFLWSDQLAFRVEVARDDETTDLKFLFDSSTLTSFLRRPSSIEDFFSFCCPFPPPLHAFALPLPHISLVAQSWPVAYMFAFVQ